MTTTFYTDAFKGTSSDESAFQELTRALRKSKKKHKELKQSIKEQRTVEEKRAAEEQKRAIELAAQPKEKSFWERIGDAIEKAIPRVLEAVATVFTKYFLHRKFDKKCDCSKKDKKE